MRHRDLWKTLIGCRGKCGVGVSVLLGFKCSLYRKIMNVPKYLISRPIWKDLKYLHTNLPGALRIAPCLPEHIFRYSISLSGISFSYITF